MEVNDVEDENHHREQCLSLATSLTSWLNDSEILQDGRHAEEVGRFGLELG